MKRDLFIDNNIAAKFSNPQDPEYIKLADWLLHFNEEDVENKDNYAHLVVSKKLLIEYNRSCQHANAATSIPVIVNTLLIQDRLIRKTNDEIKAFKLAFFSKAVLKKMRSNNEDREHLPLVILSDRKYALTYDVNFTYDLMHFPGFNVVVEKRPEKLKYAT